MEGDPERGSSGQNKRKGKNLIYTELTNKAMKLAYAAHKQQFDNGGIPYIFHPFHLAEQMDTERRICIALLHDVVEDTDVTLEQLQEQFPQEITRPVALLTHVSQENYYDYVGRVCTDLDDSFVKLADLLHNMTEARVQNCGVGESEKNRWHAKYMKALYLVVRSIEDQTSGDESLPDQNLLNHLIRSYPGRKRANAVIHIDKKSQEYLKADQMEQLKDLPVTEQLNYFQVEYTEKRTGTLDKDYFRQDKFSLSEMLNANRTLLIAEGCVVGFMDICNLAEHCKRRVSPVLINGAPRMLKEKSDMIQVSDHHAKVCETESIELVWKEIKS